MVSPILGSMAVLQRSKTNICELWLLLGVLATCLLLGSSALRDHSIDERQQTGFTVNRRTTTLHTSRQRRSAIALRRIRKLLLTAKPFYSDGLGRVFVKSGGYKQAVDDFESLNPAVARHMEDNSKNLIGFVGDKSVTVKTNGASTTLTIHDRLDRYYKYYGDQVIVYND